MKHSYLLVLFLGFSHLQVADLRADRIGYAFQGSLSPPLIGSNKLFGIDIVGTHPIKGQFWYELTPSEPGAPGQKKHAQLISGGLSLVIGDKLALSADQYVVSVWDNLERKAPIQTVDVFQVSFTRGLSTSDPSLLVNGVPWDKQAFINIELNWPADTFAGADEPKLTFDRPAMSWPVGFSPIAAVASGTSAPRLFSITSISQAVPEPHGGLIALLGSLVLVSCVRQYRL